MRVVVTGGAGFIGSHVADMALGEGHEVLILDDLSTGRRENLPAGSRFEQIDLRDGAAVEAAILGFRPDVVSHQGAQTSVSRSVREPVLDAQSNVLGTLHLLEALRKLGGGRIVLASTGGAIYGEVAEGTRAGVDHPLAPLSPYACSKLAAEAYLRMYAAEHGLRTTVLRYANVYGPRQDPHGEAGVVAIFSQRLLANEPIQINARREPGDDGCIRDYVFVDDVVRLNRLAIEGEITAPIVNVCTGSPASTRAVAEQLASASKSSSEFRNGPRRAGDLERSVLEPSTDPRLVATVALADGLARTIAWFSTRPR